MQRLERNEELTEALTSHSSLRTRNCMNKRHLQIDAFFPHPA